MSNMRRIVITGITRGLGRSLVDRFVDLNHMIYGCGRSGSHINELAARFSLPHRFDHVAGLIMREDFSLRRNGHIKRLIFY